MAIEFCGLTLPKPLGADDSLPGCDLTKSEQDRLITEFMFWQDAGARPLPLVLGGKFPGEGWPQAASPTVELFSDLVRGRHTQGIGVPLRESDVVIDIEGRARDRLPSILEAASQSGGLPLLTRAVQGLTEETPSGGLHIHLAVVDGSPSRKTILARRPKPGDTHKAEVLVEALGYGQQVVVSPSGGLTHPSGRPYRRLCGAPYSIASVSSDELRQLYALFRLLDEMPAPQASEVPNHCRLETRVERDFNARTSWEEILEPHGWRKGRVHRGRTIQTQHWTRPGKNRGTSATTVRGSLCVFSTSTSLPEFQLPQVAGGRGTCVLSKFDAYTWLNHGGDRQAALSEASRRGFGKTPQSRPLESGTSPASDVAFLADCLASAIKTGPKSKEDIIAITLRVAPGDILLRVANRERRATGRPTIRRFDGANAPSLRWACEKVARHAIRSLVLRGEAAFNEGSWVLTGLES